MAHGTVEPWSKDRYTWDRQAAKLGSARSTNGSLGEARRPKRSQDARVDRGLKSMSTATERSRPRRNMLDRDRP